jgi:hypothetical protein
MPIVAALLVSADRGLGRTSENICDWTVAGAVYRLAGAAGDFRARHE